MNADALYTKQTLATAVKYVIDSLGQALSDGLQYLNVLKQ